MDSKLTLKLENAVIERAKEYAKSNKTSLSKLIERYLDSLTGKIDEETTPLVESLTGVVDLKNIDDKKEYIDYLVEKYK